MARKILLVDESAMLRRVAANILQTQPSRYEVTSASRALEGFATACAGGIDLILLDCKTAEAAGLDVCQRLLMESRTEKVPVVLLVGRGFEPHPDHLLPPNVVATLHKPFAPEELSGLVNAIVDFTKVGSTLAEVRASLHPGGGALWETSASPAETQRERPVETRRGTDASTLLPSGGAPLQARDGVAPTDYGTPIRGETHQTSLSSIMHSTADIGLTGILRFWSGKEPATEVLFDRGHLVVISTRDGQGYAAQAANVLPEKVSRATLDEAIAEQSRTGTPFLLALGTCGLLSKAAAVALLEQFGQKHFARLWPKRFRPSLSYEFEVLDTLPPYALRLSPRTISLDEWLLATTRHLRNEDVVEILRHEGTLGTPFFTPEGKALLQNLSLNELETAFLRMVSPRHDLPSIAAALRLPPEAAYLMLYRFRCLEAMGYRPSPAAFVMTPRTFLRRVLPLQR